MAVPFERLKTIQLNEYAQLAIRQFDACETTRDENDYCPPPLTEPGFPFRKTTTYESALARFLKTKQPVRLLDLGCGAGFWLENQAQNPQIEAYGITAKDYRAPADRPPVVFKHFERHQKDGHLMPIYQSPDGRSTYYDYDLEHTAAIAAEHYLIGDVHDLLRQLPENYFHLIVSHQACRYLFDPLRVLKQINRVLKPSGYAFLESFSPFIFDQNGSLLEEEQVQQVLNHTGLTSTFGTFYPAPEHEKFGLALKKTKPHFHLPLEYRGIIPHPSLTNKTQVVTYQLI